MKYFSICAVLMMLFTSCEDGGILIETDISERNVVLLSPGNNVEISTNVVFFDWETVEDATEYEIQVALPDFDATEQLLINTTDSVTTNQVELAIGDYQWRVRAKNNNSETSYSVASFSVVPIENFVDNVVVLSNPVNGLVTNQPTQILNWELVSKATQYRLQVVLNGSIENEQTTTETSLSILLPEGMSSWQIRAEKDGESTAYSSRDILIDTMEPNAPSLISPIDGTELTSKTVSFEWSRAPIEGSTEIDEISIYRDMALTDLVLTQEATSPFDTTLDNGTYYWIVQASDAAGNVGNPSSVFSFTVNLP